MGQDVKKARDKRFPVSAMKCKSLITLFLLVTNLIQPSTSLLNYSFRETLQAMPLCSLFIHTGIHPLALCLPLATFYLSSLQWLIFLLIFTPSSLFHFQWTCNGKRRMISLALAIYPVPSSELFPSSTLLPFSSITGLDSL